MVSIVFILIFQNQYKNDVYDIALLTFFRIKLIRSSGLMKHWKEMFWPPEDACSLKTDGQITVKPATVRDLGGIFFIAGLGTNILNIKHLLYFNHEIVFTCSLLFNIDNPIL